MEDAKEGECGEAALEGTKEDGERQMRHKSEVKTALRKQQKDNFNTATSGIR